MNPRVAAALLGAAAVVAVSVGARAEDAAPPATFAGKLAASVHRLVDAAIVARPPKLVPPKQLSLTWKLARLGSLDLGGSLVTLAAADLDGDGKGELYAVTATEVVVIGAADKKLKELGRAPFAGERAPWGPRDIVGTAVAESGALVATVSTYQRSLHVRWVKGALVATPGNPGFPLCPGEVAPLSLPRNYFGDATTGFYAVRCSDSLVDGDGYPLRSRAQLALTNKLDVAIERCAARGLGCEPTARTEVGGVGVAFEIADVDRDGKPDLLAAAAGPPGEPDTLRVLTLGDDDKKPRFKKAFAAGGIAGIAVTDLDGDGAPEAIIAVRIGGASRVDLWRLE